MITVEYLRSLAELNLCEDCFQKYKALIEPSIKGYLAQPLGDWQQAESHISQILMETKGVFKRKTRVISFEKGEEEKVADYVDVKVFRELKNWKFKWKIDYLHKIGILQDSSYRLLDKAREARNKIHGEPIEGGMSEQDYTLFSMASWIANQIWSALMIDWEKDISANIRSNAEKVAEQWLSQLKN